LSRRPRLAPPILTLVLGLGGSPELPAQAAPPATTPPAAPAAARKPAARPAAASNGAFEDLARRAAAAHTARELEEAVDLYRQALKLRPSWTEGRFGLGAVLYELDQHTEARVAFRRVTATEPKNAPAWAMQGLCSFRLQEHETSLSELQKGRDLGLGENSELQAVASYHVALLLIRFGRFEVAYEVLREFALRDRDSPSVVEAFGLAILRLPFLPSEAPVVKREMILMAGRAGYQLARGLRSPATRRTFDVMVQRYPEEPNIRYAWGVYLLQDEPEAALAEFRRTLSLDPAHVPALCQISLQLIKEGRHQEARPSAELAVQTDPRNFVARNVLGRTLLELGETERAVEELEAGARLAPDSPQMYFHLARAYQRAGRREDADKARVTFMRLEKASRDRTPAGERKDSATE
jgi:tetratricopeptide (TPR) repeat protein